MNFRCDHCGTKMQCYACIMEERDYYKEQAESLRSGLKSIQDSPDCMHGHWKVANELLDKYPKEKE